MHMHVWKTNVALILYFLLPSVWCEISTVLKQEFAPLQPLEIFLWLLVDVLFPPRRTGSGNFPEESICSILCSKQHEQCLNGGYLIHLLFLWSSCNPKAKISLNTTREYHFLSQVSFFIEWKKPYNLKTDVCWSSSDQHRSNLNSSSGSNFRRQFCAS